jgi:hypothetical protein
MTTWISPGWLDSFKIAIEGFTMPPVFTGVYSTKESIAGLITAAGFTNVDVQSIKFEHTDDMGRYLKYMGEVAKPALQGEAGKKYEAAWRWGFCFDLGGFCYYCREAVSRMFVRYERNISWLSSLRVNRLRV